MLKSTRNKTYKFVCAAVFSVLVLQNGFKKTVAHADFGDLSSSADYILSASGSDADSLASSPVAGWILFLNSLKQFYSDTQYDLISDGVTFSEISGTYYNGDGEKKFASLFIYSMWRNPSASISRDFLIGLSDDFGISCTCPASDTFHASFDEEKNLYFTYSSNVHSSGTSCLVGSVYYQSGGSWSANSSPFSDTPVYLDETTLSSRFKVGTYYGLYPIFQGDGKKYDFPSGLMSLAEIDDYFNGEFRDYVVLYYPEYIYLFPDPPRDPLEINQIELPPDLPNADFHDIEIPSETFPTGLTDGAGFWFSAFDDMVTNFGLKPFIIIFLCFILLLVILNV